MESLIHLPRLLLDTVLAEPYNGVLPQGFNFVMKCAASCPSWFESTFSAHNVHINVVGDYPRLVRIAESSCHWKSIHRLLVLPMERNSAINVIHATNNLKSIMFHFVSTLGIKDMRDAVTWPRVCEFLDDFASDKQVQKLYSGVIKTNIKEIRLVLVHKLCGILTLNILKSETGQFLCLKGNDILYFSHCMMPLSQARPISGLRVGKVHQRDHHWPQRSLQNC